MGNLCGAVHLLAFLDPLLSFYSSLFPDRYGVGGSQCLQVVTADQSWFQAKQSFDGGPSSPGISGLPIPVLEAEQLEESRSYFSFASQAVRMLESGAVLLDTFSFLLGGRRAQNSEGSF